MRITATLALACVICSAAFAAETPPEKKPAGASVTTAEIVARCAAKYSAAKTYYEESRLTMVLNAEGRYDQDKIDATVAFKRPATMRVNLSGDVEAALSLDGRSAVYYDRVNNEYTKKDLDSSAEFVTELDDLKLQFTPASQDFAAAFRQDSLSAGEPKETSYNGKAAYEVEVTRASGKTETFIFDKATSAVMEIRTVLKVDTGASPGRIVYVKSISRLLIDEVPKDSAGKEVDVFSFSLPRTARERPGGNKGSGAEAEPRPASTLSSL